MNREERSKLMSKIRGNNLKPETLVEQTFRLIGVIPERNPFDLPGKPDFVFRCPKIAIFVNGCFWHACPAHMKTPKSNHEFWKKKFAANVWRDNKTARRLRRNGWHVLTIWEHDTKLGVARIAEVITSRLSCTI